MTRVLYVMDPLMTSVNPETDSTFALMLEGQRRGHENFVCTLDRLFTDAGRGFALAERATVQRAPRGSHATVASAERIAFDDLDVIWMRKDPPVDDAYLFACMILDLADRERTLVFNDSRSLRTVHEKMWALRFPALGPRTRIASSAQLLVEFIQQQGKGVIKPLHLMGGMGVLAFAADDPNLKSAADLLTAESKKPAVAQEFLPAVRQGDKRVILVDGEPVGAVLRVPRADDVRSNLHVGGSAVKADVDDADRAIAAVIGPHLKEAGLFFVGIDVIGGKLTEVNVTSPTGLQEIDRLDARSGDRAMPAILWTRAEAKLNARD
jgi:glutathione synthase